MQPPRDFSKYSRGGFFIEAFVKEIKNKINIRDIEQSVVTYLIMNNIGEFVIQDAVREIRDVISFAIFHNKNLSVEDSNK